MRHAEPAAPPTLPAQAGAGAPSSAGGARLRPLEHGLVAAACLVALAVYGSFGRPIWIDEFLHFALGSHRSLAEVWDTISVTTVAVNHGQTGFYLLVDWALLRLFGASAVALRLPSLLCASLLLASAALVLRQRGLGVGWQLLVLVALLEQTVLMYFVGEARPYLPLAAAAAGTLAYYLAPPEARARPSTRALGIVSVLLGALVHPYYPVYAAALFGFAHLHAVAEGRRPGGLRPLLANLNVPLVGAAALLYLALARATWLRGGPSFTLDPFQWIAPEGVYRTFARTHLEFVDGTAARTAVLVLVLGSGAAWPFLPARWRARARPVVAPAALLAVALGVSLLLSWVSYRRHYWVLPRQWVASMALAPVAVVWWWAEVGRAVWPVHLATRAVVVAGAVLLVAPQLKPVSRQGREALALAWSAPPAGASPAAPAPPRVAPKDNDGWVELANRNVRAGGPVWDVFREYYGK